MDKPLVTVIVPAYNASDYIAETLESILAQTYENLEVIVVDDGSTDNTAEIVKSYTSGITYIHQENSGSCAAPRNNGLQHAKGEFVTFFDADDIMLPDKIAHQVNDLLDHPEAVICISNYRNFTQTQHSADHFSNCPALADYLNEVKGTTFTLTSLACRSILIDENFTIASSPLFRTQTVKSLGGFKQSLRACEDFHLIYRVAMEGDVVVNATVGFERRLHDLNMSSDNERMLRNLIGSRSSLSREETDKSLRKRLEFRVRRYRRDLQTCLVLKGRLKDAVRMYLETFPPKSFSDLNHDIRQGIKILMYYITPGRMANRPH